MLTSVGFGAAPRAVRVEQKMGMQGKATLVWYRWIPEKAERGEQEKCQRAKYYSLNKKSSYCCSARWIKAQSHTSESNTRSQAWLHGNPLYPQRSYSHSSLWRSDKCVLSLITLGPKPHLLKAFMAILCWQDLMKEQKRIIFISGIG